MIKTYVYNCFIGGDQAYIYIWLSKKHKVVYVGMTNSYAGTIGRASGHFIQKGTFRCRFADHKGYGLENADDLVLLSFPLPKERVYYSVERSYREAIESIVQKELQTLRGKFNPTFDIVSRVRSSPRTTNSEVRRIAKEIVELFMVDYNTI
jgi:hypothetical protein